MPQPQPPARPTPAPEHAPRRPRTFKAVFEDGSMGLVLTQSEVGLSVTSVEGAAHRAGVHPMDVVVELNGRAIAPNLETSAFAEMIGRARDRGPVTLTFRTHAVVESRDSGQGSLSDGAESPRPGRRRRRRPRARRGSIGEHTPRGLEAWESPDGWILEVTTIGGRIRYRVRA